MDLLAPYPYLGWCLLLLTVSACAALCCPREQRRVMLLSSALTIPVGMFAFLYIPDYWDPAQVFRWHAGPEDILFGLANGTTVWVLATRGRGRPLALRLRAISVIGRYLSLLLAGLLLYFCLSALGIRPMDATLLVIAMAAIVLLALRADLRRMVLPTALSFALVYALLTLTAVRLWPQFSNQWNHDRLWGVVVGGVPLEEFGWGLAFGATWPLIVAHVAGARLVDAGEPVPELHSPEFTRTPTKAREH